MSQKPRSLDEVRDRIHVKRYSIFNKQVFRKRIRRHILFHNERYPGGLGVPAAEFFRTCSAVARSVVPSIQGYALSAVLSLCRKVRGL
jgi:hypothetical protein